MITCTVAENRRDPVSKHQRIRFSLSVENERAGAGRDGRSRRARPISMREQGQGKPNFPCSGDHEQDWQPYLVDACSLLQVLTIHPYVYTSAGTFNMPTSYQQRVWGREAHINWSMVTCQRSTRSELP